MKKIKLLKVNLKYLISFGVLVIFGIVSIFINNNVSASSKNEKQTIFVDIKGAINNPGVYEMENNSRVIDLINKAGGLKENADTSIINLSKKLQDENYIIIYTNEEVINYKDKIISSSEVVKEIEKNIICPDSDNDACISTNTVTSNNNNNSLININTATKEELSSLSGIGESKASKIIEYRNSNEFKTIEEIKNVPGIGDSLFEKIKNNITV